MIENILEYLKDLWRGNKLGSRSPKWSQVRTEFIKENPRCAVCGKLGTLLSPNEAHHIQSFATRPELELSKQNLIVGCREHHLWFFHLGSWKSINENAKEDAIIWASKISNRPNWDGQKWIYRV